MVATKTESAEKAPAVCDRCKRPYPQLFLVLRDGERAHLCAFCEQANAIETKTDKLKTY